MLSTMHSARGSSVAATLTVQNRRESVRCGATKPDVPLMDFADATLVHVANRTGISTVFTVDHDDYADRPISTSRRLAGSRIVRPINTASRSTMTTS